MDLSTDAMHGSREQMQRMLEQTNDGHSRLVQPFHLTTVKEMTTDISFNLLLITLLEWTN
jgi:hypothetical protein